MITAALVGRPNAGKSSLYNALTGGHAKVGNFPGITVDVLEAEVPLEGGEKLKVVDLPGVYSIEAFTDPESDEGHARRYLDSLQGQPEPWFIAQVLDSTQLAVGLRLTLELRRRGAPLIVLATQHDELLKQGSELDAAGLADALGVPVVAVSARDPQVKTQLLFHFAEVARQRQVPPKDSIEVEALAKRFTKPLSNALAAAGRARKRTEVLDSLLLHPVLAPFLFTALMTALFGAVFLVADPVTSALDAMNEALGTAIEHGLGPGWFTSLLVDGVLGGAGTVLGFLPQIVILTMAMEVIESSGYLARATFLVDRILRLAGLGGRSFVPLLTAHACAVPAIQSSRIIRDPGQRLRTILVLPLMTCSARIPTYSLLVTTFFYSRSPFFKGAIFVGLYFCGALFGFLAALILDRGMKRTGNALPLVLEMPAYRRPQARVVLRLGARAATRFIKDVGSVILVASMVLWALLTVPGPNSAQARESAPPHASERVLAMHGSLAAFVGRTLEPITRPAGFDWRINVGLIGSVGAREVMVGTLGVIFGIEGDESVTPLSQQLREARTASGSHAYSVATALALMAFFILACQCMSTLAAIRRETRSWKWAGFVFLYTYAAAYLLAVAVFQGASALGLG